MLSITETNTVIEETETVIQRNEVHEVSVTDLRGTNELYVRARDIYFRARSHRPVRAASIF